jgi:hypothetical protein
MMGAFSAREVGVYQIFAIPGLAQMTAPNITITIMYSSGFLKLNVHGEANAVAQWHCNPFS